MGSLIEAIIDFFCKFVPVRILKPYEGGVLTWCGKVRKNVWQGLYLVVPYLHDIDKIDITEQIIDMRPQSVTTRDGKSIAVSGAISYKVIDPQKALFKVQDVDVSLVSLSLGIIAHFVNSHTYDECLVVESLSLEILKGVREQATSKWGLKILNVWVTDVSEHKVLRIMTGGDSQFIPVDM